MFQRLHHTWILSLLLLVYALVQIYCINHLSVNYDEGTFAAYGRTLLKGQGNKDVMLYDSKLPINALNMLPRAVEQVFHPGLKKASGREDVIHGRYISLLAMLLLALLVYRWATQLYGQGPALFSLLLLLLCPNFLAHGIFLSSDIFACLFMAAALFFCWRFRQSRSTRHFFLASIATGLAQVSKFSMVHLFFIIPVLLLAGYLSDRKTTGLPFRPKRVALLFLLFAGANWFIISAAHLFYGMFIPLADYHFSSSTFQHLQAAFGSSGHYIPIPLPASYIRSMDIVLYFDHLGGGVPGALNGAPYILGQHRVQGFWYYYFVALWYKLPLAVLLLFALGLIVYLRRAAARQFLQNELWLLAPALYYLIYMNFFYSTQVGIRHIIIILPLLYIFTGFFCSHIKTVRGRYFVYTLLAYELISVACYFPHFLPYTNELITDKKMAYTKLADTNICYGEGVPFLRRWLDLHPQAVYLPDKIMPGTIVMEVNDVLDLSMGTLGKYDWVAPLIPIDHIHSQYLVYEITTAQADSLKKLHPWQTNHP